jgi:hypothetical protein
MPVYNVFTWNMQRARSISQWNRPLAHAVTQQEKTIRERYRVLQTLVNWADFGFITEPGMDIRQNLNNFNLPGLNRHFCASVLADNQTDASACRPVIYSKIPFSRIPPTTESYISYLSGAAEAYPYPAAGIVTLAQGDGQGNNELLLLSFHATSGYNANENCRGYFESFYQNDYLQRAIPSGLDRRRRLQLQCRPGRLHAGNQYASERLCPRRLLCRPERHELSGHGGNRPSNLRAIDNKQSPRSSWIRGERLSSVLAVKSG